MQQMLFIMLILIAIAYAFTNGKVDVGALVPAQSAAVITAPPPASSVWSATGTLVFYPNNIGLPVPYLYYQDQGGRTATKALTFPDGPPSGFSSWGGSRVSVVGTLEQEHVAVSRISYISAP